MAEQSEQAVPAVEDALPQIFMSREKLLFTFPGGKPFEIRIEEALTALPEIQGLNITALLWFMNVQMHTLVTMMQQASAQSRDPEKLAVAAMDQVRALVPGLDDLLTKMPDGAQAKVRSLLSGAGGKGLG